MYSLLTDQLVVGISNLGIALATATALAAGVVFGEWIARRLRRPRILHRYEGLRRPRVRRSRGRRGEESGRRAPVHWQIRRLRRRGTTPWLPSRDQYTRGRNPGGADRDASR
jgi:hypothetical protein